MIRDSLSQQTRHIDLMLNQRWPTVYDGGPTLVQHCVGASCLLGAVSVIFTFLDVAYALCT